MTSVAKYFKFGLLTMATFLMWLLLGSILSMAAPLVGLKPFTVYEVFVNSASSLTFLIAFVVFYFHRRIFHRDIFKNADTDHLMVVASVAFLPLFIYLIGVSLIEQLLRTHIVSLAMVGDTLRHGFMVIIPVYFITLVTVGLLFAGLHFAFKKLLSARKK